jgi:hypothetical protein
MTLVLLTWIAAQQINLITAKIGGQMQSFQARLLMGLPQNCRFYGRHWKFIIKDQEKSKPKKTAITDS